MSLSYSYSVELHRNSHRKCSKKGVLKIFVKFTRKHLSQSLIKKVKETLLQNFIKRNFIKRNSDKCFPMNFAKLFRTHILKNTCERLRTDCADKYGHVESAD